MNIKYMEENLIFNVNGDVYAYYEWMPYNYSFISEDKALGIFQDINDLISASRAEHFHLLLVSTEESVSDAIERCKGSVKGELAPLAFAHLDGIRDYLIDCNGKYEVEYRYYIGFQLSESDYELEERSLKNELKIGLQGFTSSVNKTLFNDYTTIANTEVDRYLKLEQLLRYKVAQSFHLCPVQPKDYAYILKHLNGQFGMAYETYDYHPELIVEDDVTKIKTYDVVRLADCYIDEKKRHLEISTEDRTELVTYMALSDIIGENSFPFGSEIFYYQQQQLDFPIDVSIHVECIKNQDALQTVRTKKMELKDLDENALQSGNDSSNNLVCARKDALELEAELESSRENLYKINYVVRVGGATKEELSKRFVAIRDYYKNFNMVLQRPLGDQIGLHEEFYPSATRSLNDYVQYVNCDFLSSLGFGAARKLGERDGIPIGYNVETLKTVYIQPWLAAQGVAGSVTNALAKVFIGSLGGGKSGTENLLLYYTVLFGGKVLLVDPKGERGNWVDDLGMLGEHLNLIDITSSEKNKGLIDPFSIMPDKKDAESLALDILTFITGIGVRDAERFPILREHVKKVAISGEPKGMLHVIEELRNTNTEISNALASHIESFTDLSVAGLLFGDGNAQKTLQVDHLLNVVQIQNLVLPDSETPIEKYTTSEILSIAILIALSTFSLQFIHQDRSIFKLVVLDEAWSWMQVNEGKTLANKLIRAGRSMNAAIDFSTQNCNDMNDEKMKNNIGMKFAFRSRDISEIKETLAFFGLEYTDDNANRIRNLKNGQCLFQDIYGQCGVIYIDHVFEDLKQAFDTRPPMSGTRGW